MDEMAAAQYGTRGEFIDYPKLAGAVNEPATTTATRATTPRRVRAPPRSIPLRWSRHHHRHPTPAASLLA